MVMMTVVMFRARPAEDCAGRPAAESRSELPTSGLGWALSRVCRLSTRAVGRWGRRRVWSH